MLDKQAIAVRRSDRRIVFSSWDEMSQSKDLYFVSGDRSGAAPFPGSDIWDDEIPSWSPTGRYVVFTSNRSGHAEIWALDTETQKFRQLTGSSSRSARRVQAVWSPDGTRVAVLEAYGYTDYAIAIYPTNE